MITIIDYGAGNIKSVEKALELLGEGVIVSDDPDRITKAEKLILPGVGSFGAAMEALRRRSLDTAIREQTKKGVPLLGICLGLQMLFDRSEESPGVEGLALLPGEILKIPEGGGRKIPHMGWNSLEFPHPGRLFGHFTGNPYVYFVHSYYLHAADERMISAATQYGVTIHAAVEHENIFGCQFHPEKSSDVGLSILEKFIAL